MLKKKDVCQLLSVSPATLDRWEAAGSFPKRIRIGNFRVAWWQGEVWEWLERQAQRPLD
jgi:predicted DNA-binding transcriptional regulator AlpA